MSNITFEFDVYIDGQRCDRSETFASSNPDWRCRWGKNGGFLAEPPQLPHDGLSAASFVGRHADNYASQLSAMRFFGKEHRVRVAVYADISKVAAFSLALEPSTMALLSSLGYEIDFCVYPCGPDEEE